MMSNSGNVLRQEGHLEKVAILKHYGDAGKFDGDAGSDFLNRQEFLVAGAQRFVGHVIQGFHPLHRLLHRGALIVWDGEPELEDSFEEEGKPAHTPYPALPCPLVGVHHLP